MGMAKAKAYAKTAFKPVRVPLIAWRICYGVHATSLGGYLLWCSGLTKFTPVKSPSTTAVANWPIFNPLTTSKNRPAFHVGRFRFESESSDQFPPPPPPPPPPVNVLVAIPMRAPSRRKRWVNAAQASGKVYCSTSMSPGWMRMFSSSRTMAL